MGQRWLAVLGWVVAAIAATAVGLLAIALLSRGFTDGSVAPVTSAEVDRGLAATTTPEPTPTGPATTPPPTTPTTGSPGPTPVTRVFGSRGGTVVARCTGDRAYLVAWSPAQGWSVDDTHRGPATSVRVVFEGEDDAVDDLVVTLTVRCGDGTPAHTVATKGQVDRDSGDSGDSNDSGDSGDDDGGRDEED